MNLTDTPTAQPEESCLNNLGRLLDAQWLDRDTLVWLEGRSDRRVLVAGSLSRGWRRDLTRDWRVGARVGYGGGDFGVGPGFLCFVDGNDLYRQSVDASPPVLLARFDCPVCSPVISPDGEWVAVIAGGEDRDRLYLTPAHGGSPVLIHEGPDFIMQPNWHPEGRRLAWVEWNAPHMPWDESAVVWAWLDASSRPRILRTEASREPGRSHFQPAFSPDGRHLAVVSDGSGWWNLELLDPDRGTTRYRMDDKAEHGVPAWVHGLRSYGWTGPAGKLVVVRSRQAQSSLEVWTPETGTREPIRGLEKWTDLRQPTTNPWTESLALVASNPMQAPRLLEWRRDGVRTLARCLPEPVQPDSGDISTPVQGIEFGTGQNRCHGLLVLPGANAATPATVAIRIHGGPTSHYGAEFEEEVRFFLGLGIGVLSLNYRGSSGYSRPYREMLRGNWGEADVEDVRAAAAWLVREGIAAPGRIVLTGGSAGGFTALLALARFPGAFAGAICRYPVVDLLGLEQDTHRFERHYLDGLIGRLPEAREKYLGRSPSRLAEGIRDPLALFHGDADEVTPLGPVKQMAEGLVRRGVRCSLHVFPGEGHGWRHSDTIAEYYRRSREFLADLGLIVP